MPELIQLPGDQTALLRTSEELSNRAVKELRRAARKVGAVGQKLKDLGLEDIRDVPDDADDDTKKAANEKAVSILSRLTDDEDDNLDLFQRVCTIVRLIEWSLPLPLPTTVDEVDDLPIPVYKALTTEAAKLDLNETFGKDEGLMDPKADTGDSESSELHLEVVSS